LVDSLDFPTVVKKEMKKVFWRAYALAASKAMSMADRMDHWTVVSMVGSMVGSMGHLLVDQLVDMTAVQRDPHWVVMKVALKVGAKAGYLAERKVD
jgi:hypothetical protein